MRSSRSSSADATASPSSIQSARCLDPSVKVENLPEKPAASHRITVVRPCPRIGDIAGQIYLVTDIPEQRVIRLPIKGQIRRAKK